MSEAAGRDLEWYFRQALTQPGYPKLDLTWRHRGGRLTVTIRQVQPEEWGLYRIPDLAVDVDGHVHRVTVEGRETIMRIEGVRRPPREVRPDPDGWWLMESTVKSEK
jgi:aminopeptidase N